MTNLGKLFRDSLKIILNFYEVRKNVKQLIFLP